jgi:hypothetical protein
MTMSFDAANRIVSIVQQVLTTTSTYGRDRE